MFRKEPHNRIMSHATPSFQAELSKDLQVYHLQNQHHPDNLYNNIRPEYIASVQRSKNPSHQYYSEMKNLYQDELDHGLEQYRAIQNRKSEEKSSVRREYRQNPNGLIVYLEKEEDKRNRFIQECLAKQEERNRRFIDAAKQKETRINQYIESNYNPVAMYRSQMLYDEQKVMTNLDVWRSNAAMVADKSHLRAMDIENKKINLGQSAQIEEEVAQSRLRKKGSPYVPQKTEISEKENAQAPRLPFEKSHVFRCHNPITNPIEYHVDNPYFLRKLQKRSQQSTQRQQ